MREPPAYLISGNGTTVDFSLRHSKSIKHQGMFASVLPKHSLTPTASPLSSQPQSPAHIIHLISCSSFLPFPLLFLSPLVSGIEHTPFSLFRVWNLKALSQGKEGGKGTEVLSILPAFFPPATQR